MTSRLDEAHSSSSSSSNYQFFAFERKEEIQRRTGILNQEFINYAITQVFFFLFFFAFPTIYLIRLPISKDSYMWIRGIHFTLSLCVYDGMLTLVELSHSALLADLTVDSVERLGIVYSCNFYD